MDHLDFGGRHAAFHEGALESRRLNDNAAGTGIDYAAQHIDNPKDRAARNHAGGGERIRPQVLNVIDDGDAPHRRNDDGSQPDGQWRMINVKHIGPAHDQAVDRH
jgi:hypothetical protein